MAQAGGTDPAGLPAALAVRAARSSSSGCERAPCGAASVGARRARRSSRATTTRASVPRRWPRWTRPTGSRAGLRRRRLDGGRVDAIRSVFETDCDVFLVFNGTAANSLALSAMCRSTDAIVCHAMAHINVDECGAPEFFSGGAKLLTADTPHAKLTPDAVRRSAVTPHDEHCRGRARSRSRRRPSSAPSTRRPSCGDRRRRARAVA